MSHPKIDPSCRKETAFHGRFAILMNLLIPLLIAAYLGFTMPISQDLIKSWHLSFTSPRQLILLLIAYIGVEMWRFQRFQRLLRRVNTRCYQHKGGGNFLHFILQLLKSDRNALSLDRKFFMRYAAEGDTTSIGYGGGTITWQRLYSWWAWGCGRPFDSAHDPELHADLLKAADWSCRSLGIAPPPPVAPAASVPALSPFGFGICEVRASFKPLPVRTFLRSILPLTRSIFWGLGFRRLVEPMPCGDLVCWTDVKPRNGAKLTGRRPVVFMHGLGLGNFTYLPLFLGKHSTAWRSGGCIIVEVPNMTCASDVLEGRPDVVHTADALGRLLRDQLGYGDYEYDIVCHSLSSYLAATLCNDGSPCRPRRSVLIDPTCFLEGVEVCSRFPFRTPEECREFAEHTVLFPAFLPMAVRYALGHVFRYMVCRDIFTQYTVLRWNGTDATHILWHSVSAEALVCLSDDDNFVPSERVARHCESHFPRIRLHRMPGKDHGSFVIEGDLRKQLLQRITNFLEGEADTTSSD
jgi:hypothetical protein